MLKLFAHIRTLVETRYNVSKDRYPDLPWQGVSAFVFLRFFTPAILHPHIYGFWPGRMSRVFSHYEANRGNRPLG